MNVTVFSPLLLAALGCGLLAGGGLALLIASIVGMPRRPASGPSRLERLSAFARRRGAAAGAAAVATLVITRWPVAAVGAALIVAFSGKLFGGARAERKGVEQMEALAGWIESLRDTMAGAVGLEQAIQSSTEAAAASLRPHLHMLVDLLRARRPMAEALDAFAESLGDGSADMVIIALKDNARQRGPGFRDVLTALAETARDEADMRRKVMAERAGTRRSIQIVTGIIIVFPLGMALFNPQFVAPYRTLQGQAVLAVVAIFFGGAMLWLRKLSVLPPPARLLVRGENR